MERFYFLGMGERRSTFSDRTGEEAMAEFGQKEDERFGRSECSWLLK